VCSHASGETSVDASRAKTKHHTRVYARAVSIGARTRPNQRVPRATIYPHPRDDVTREIPRHPFARLPRDAPRAIAIARDAHERHENHPTRSTLSRRVTTLAFALARTSFVADARTARTALVVLALVDFPTTGAVRDAHDAVCAMDAADMLVVCGVCEVYVGAGGCAVDARAQSDACPRARTRHGTTCGDDVIVFSACMVRTRVIETSMYYQRARDLLWSKNSDIRHALHVRFGKTVEYGGFGRTRCWNIENSDIWHVLGVHFSRCMYLGYG
jgi:hypothetical protein